MAATVSVLNLGCDTEAFLRDSDAFSLGGLRVQAEDFANVETKVGRGAGGAVGVGGSVSVNTLANVIRAQVLGGHLNADGALVVSANSNESLSALVGTAAGGVAAVQSANSSNVAGGLVAGGAAVASATSNTTTQAYLGTNVQLTSGSLEVNASGINENNAATTAGSGGVITGGAAVPTVHFTSNVLAKVGDSDSVDLTQGGSGSLNVAALHIASGGANVESTAIGLLSGAGAIANDTVNSTVQAAIGNSATVMSLSSNITATNRTDLNDNTKGTTGGLVSAAGANSNVTLSLTTLVTVGSYAHLEVDGSPSNNDVLNLKALNIINSTNKVTFTTAGALAGSSAGGSITTNSDLGQVIIGDHAEVLSSGKLQMSANGTGDIHNLIQADTYGLGTVSLGGSDINVHPDNEVVIQGYAHLRAYGDLNLTAGRNADPDEVASNDHYTVEARWDGYAGSLIPISSVDASANIIQDNHITIASQALAQTARQANLYAARLTNVDLTGKAKAVSWVSDVSDALYGLLGGNGQEAYSGSDEASANGIVEVDGTVETGLTRHQKLELSSGYDPNDPSLTAPGVAQADPNSPAFQNVLNNPPQLPYSLYGDRIHIDAEYINLNGIIQSGRDSYTLNIDSSALSEAQNLINQGKTGRIYLPQTSSLNTGFALYYNTATQRFEVDDLKISGGYIELFGHILNTGHGQIKVLGGYSSITVNNTTGPDIVLNQLDDSQRGAGQLLIYDKTSNGNSGHPNVGATDALATGSAAYTTLYQWTLNGVQVTTNGTTSDSSHQGTVASTGYSSQYLPASGWRYGWTTVVEENKIYSKYIKSGAWLGTIPDIFQNSNIQWDSVEVEGTPHFAGDGPYYYYDNSSSANDAYDYSHSELTESSTGVQLVKHDDYWTWYGSHVYESWYQKVDKDEELSTHTVRSASLMCRRARRRRT